VVLNFGPTFIVFGLLSGRRSIPNTVGGPTKPTITALILIPNGTVGASKAGCDSTDAFSWTKGVHAARTKTQNMPIRQYRFDDSLNNRSPFTFLGPRNQPAECKRVSIEGPRSDWQSIAFWALSMRKTLLLMTPDARHALELTNSPATLGRTSEILPLLLVWLDVARI
jgi:hypothetical protein